MDITLKRHQRCVVTHMKKKRGALAIHSTGTGKTITAVATVLELLKDGVVDHVVFVSPVSLQYNFVKTLADINRNKRMGIRIDRLDKKISVFTIQGFVDKRGLCKNALLIVDEAHNLRTKNGKYFQQVLGCAKEAERVLLLSATPIVNRPSDIVNMVALVRGEDPLDMSDFYYIIKSPSAKEYLSNIFHFYERSENDPDFPYVKIVEKFLPMSKRYEELYDKVEQGEAAGVEDFKDKNIKAFYNGIRRATNKIDKISPKVAFIINTISHDQKKKYVVFSHFKTMGLDVLQELLKDMGVKYRVIMGATPKHKRDEAVELYNNDEITVLLISKAGGEGLDLKGTDVVFVMEPTWNFAVLKQIIGRGARFKSHEGNKRKVIVYRLFLVRDWEHRNIKRLTKSEELVPPDDAESRLFSIDLFLRNYALAKNDVNKEFLEQMRTYRIRK